MRKLPLSLFFLLAAASVYAQSGSAKAAPDGFFNQWLARTSASIAARAAVVSLAVAAGNSVTTKGRWKAR